MGDPKWMGRDSLGRKTVLYDDYLKYKQKSCHIIKELEAENQELFKLLKYFHAISDINSFERKSLGTIEDYKIHDKRVKALEK